MQKINELLARNCFNFAYRNIQNKIRVAVQQSFLLHLVGKTEDAKKLLESLLTGAFKDTISYERIVVQSNIAYLETDPIKASDLLDKTMGLFYKLGINSSEGFQALEFLATNILRVNFKMLDLKDNAKKAIRIIEQAKTNYLLQSFLQVFPIY